MNRVTLASLLITISGPALGQTAADTASPATAAPEEPAICTDRPTKANATCTVPAGKLQLETDLINWTRINAGGVRTDVVLYTNPTLKLGITDRSDIQFNIAPYETINIRTGGVSSDIGGVGDLFVRFKQRITDDSSKVQVGFIPFIKVPTAKRGIGNREVEGGLALPVSISLPQSFTLTFGPELDLLLDANDEKRHLNLVNVINLSKSVGKLTLIGELWGAQNFDPSGTVQQYSADAAIACAVSKTLQLDVGGSFGLNRNTAGVQLYAGVSTRF